MDNNLLLTVKNSFLVANKDVKSKLQENQDENTIHKKVKQQFFYFSNCDKNT